MVLGCLDSDFRRIQMVTDNQVRLLMSLINQEQNFDSAAAKAGMCAKTARKWRKSKKLPSQCKPIHDWPTHEDAFKEEWPWVAEYLKNNEGIEAKSLFEALQREHPGKYTEGQLRTFQRRVKLWRALEGPGKETFFPQIYKPGQWCESDFTHMNSLGITINSVPFAHMLYHFVLCCSNWETGTVCFSESYESLCAGIQNAIWKLGGVPRYHRTDNLRCAVNLVGSPEAFNEKYRALAAHYGFENCKIQPRCPNENGDIEQRHNRLKKAAEQALILRGSRDFGSRYEYEMFLEELFEQLNAGRKDLLREELKVLRQLPIGRLPDYTEHECTVSHFSTVRLVKNTYSLHSRLVGEQVTARVYAEYIEIWYAQRKVDVLARLRGENGHKINYRHVIDTLVRKPGAFENYSYKDDMFPTTQFRIAYDMLQGHGGTKQGNKEYLKILELAAKDGESMVNDILRYLINQGPELSFTTVEQMVKSQQKPPAVTDVNVDEPDLTMYDQLLDYQEVLA
jgi:hypothetical protein